MPRKTKREKNKVIPFKMEFNPGLAKFEPVLPVRKDLQEKGKPLNHENNIKKSKWNFWVILIIILLFGELIFFGFYYIMRYLIG